LATIEITDIYNSGIGKNIYNRSALALAPWTI